MCTEALVTCLRWELTLLMSVWSLQLITCSRGGSDHNGKTTRQLLHQSYITGVWPNVFCGLMDSWTCRLTPERFYGQNVFCSLLRPGQHSTCNSYQTRWVYYFHLYELCRCKYHQASLTWYRRCCKEAYNVVVTGHNCEGMGMIVWQ